LLDGIQEMTMKRYWIIAVLAAVTLGAAPRFADAEVNQVPKAKAHNAAIEKLIAANYVRIYPDWKAVKVLLTGLKTTWEIQRAANGNIVSRSIWATILTRKGDKCEVYSTYWEQQYDGKQFAGDLAEHGAGATEEDTIDCSKIK
jgi:hypothetical protein